MACQAIANIVKTSLGPVGLDKVRLCYFDSSCELCHFFDRARCSQRGEVGFSALW